MDLQKVEATAVDYSFHYVEGFLEPFARRYNQWLNGDLDDEIFGMSHIPDLAQEPTVPTFTIKLKFRTPRLDAIDLSHSLGRWVQSLDAFYEGPRRHVRQYLAEFDWTIYTGFAVLKLVNDSMECDRETTCTVEDVDRMIQALWKALDNRQNERLRAVCEKARD